MVINTDFICTYQLISNYDESFMLYKVQFLQIFNLEEYDDKIINDAVFTLYNNVKSNKIIKKLITNNKYYEDDLASFMLYFRYDTLYIFHKILINIVNKNEMNEINEMNEMNEINENKNLYEEIIKIC